MNKSIEKSCFTCKHAQDKKCPEFTEYLEAFRGFMNAYENCADSSGSEKYKKAMSDHATTQIALFSKKEKYDCYEGGA